MLLLRNTLYFFLLLALPLFLSAQGYHQPIDVPLYLSGTFGEPRGSHFHSGIDIRTGGREGLKVYAIEAGTVSRIKISARGYGKALYIDHPDGCTSVYAHLQRFSPRIDSFIKTIHYQKESFELDEYLDAGALVLQRGEVIALSGNSGGSGGPHLHFEIRDTKTQIPVNPQLYQFQVDDRIAPGIHGLFVYPQNDSLLKSAKLPVVEPKNNRYNTRADTIWVNTPVVALGLHSTDRMNNSSSSNGIYSLKMQVDGQTHYSFSMDRFAFSETRFVQCHMDHEEKVLSNSSVYRCYTLPGNSFERIYDSITDGGYITLTERPIEVKFTVKDFQGNTAILQAFIGYRPDSDLLPKRTNFGQQFLAYGKENSFSAPGIDIRFPPGTFYRAVFLHYEEGPLAKLGALSMQHRVHDETEAVHSRYTISLEPDTIMRPEKMLIARIEDDEEIEAYTSSWQGLRITARPRELGVFYIALDTVPPAIEPLNIGEGRDMSSTEVIRFVIKDALSGIDTYRGTIDGKWVLFQYDKKNDLLFYEVDDHVPSGEHKLRLTVTDEVGNEQSYTCNFKN